MTLNENSICPSCKTHPVGRFSFRGQPTGEVREICLRCQNTITRNKNNEATKAKEKKIKEKLCNFCKISYMPYNCRQHFCSAACGEKSKNLEINEKWKKKELLMDR